MSGHSDVETIFGRRTYLTAAGTLLAGALAGCTAEAEPAPSAAADATTKTPTPGPKPDVEILEQPYYMGEYGSYGVKGTARNNTDETLEGVAFDTVYLDADGVQLSTGLGFVQNVAPGRTFTYDSVGTDFTLDPTQIDSYELTIDVTNY